MSRRGQAPGILWVTRDDSSPHPYLVASARRAGATVREVRWTQAQDGERPLGRMVTVGRRRAGREHPITIKVVGPRLFMKFVRAPEDVIVVYELGLVGLYAGLSKALRRGRRVVSLVEGDYQHLGRTGTAAFKLPVRRLADADPVSAEGVSHRLVSACPRSLGFRAARARHTRGLGVETDTESEATGGAGRPSARLHDAAEPAGRSARGAALPLGGFGQFVSAPVPGRIVSPSRQRGPRTPLGRTPRG